MANRINLNATSYHGAGAIAEIANEAKAHGFKKAFVCSDPDLIKFNVTSKVTDILTANGLDYELYSDIKPNPTIEKKPRVKYAIKIYFIVLLYLSILRKSIILNFINIKRIY